MLNYSKAFVGLVLSLLARRAFTPRYQLTTQDSRRDTVVTAGLLHHLLPFKGLSFPLLVLVKYLIDPEWSIKQPWTALGVLTAVVALLGFAFRLWAMDVLGRHFTFELGIRENHQLVRTGPYRVLRHPSYTGGLIAPPALMYFLGFRSWPWMVLLVPWYLLMFVVMGLRIPQEEAVLHTHFGKAWKDYCKKTWRLIPFLY